MIRVQFNDSPAVHTVEFNSTESSVILTGDTLKENHSGFKAYRLSGALLGDYSEYTECKKYEDGFIYEKKVMEC